MKIIKLLALLVCISIIIVSSIFIISMNKTSSEVPTNTMNETGSEVTTNTSMYTEKEDYIECLVRYFNEQEEMEFMIYLHNNYPEIFYDILSFYENEEVKVWVKENS